MVNANKLRAAIVLKGLTQKQVANNLDMTPKTFSDKLKKGVFGSDEIEKMISLLDIEDPVAVFFDKAVA